MQELRPHIENQIHAAKVPLGRREFLLSILIPTAVLNITSCSPDQSQEVPPLPGSNLERGATSATRSTKVVSSLRKVSLERRRELRAIEGDTSPVELNATIPEIEEIELLNSASSASPQETLRIIAWNMERGRHWRDGVKLIAEHPALKDPDILFLGEMDLGMARSGNEHTAREMASALGMNYAFGVEFLELTNGEPEEREMYPGENSWGYHGNAILSRFPLDSLLLIRFPGIEKWFGDYQKRLGGRMALVATIDLGRPVTLVSTHLETSTQDSMIREVQTRLLTQELSESFEETPIILAGDLNAPPSEPLFEILRNQGFEVEEANELSVGTRQQLVDSKVVLGDVHIDYICPRGIEVVRDVTSPKVVPAVYPPGILEGSEFLGDHTVVTTKLRLPWDLDG